MATMTGVIFLGDRRLEQLEFPARPRFLLAEAEQALQATKNDPANIKSVVVPK